ncbi:MAG: glycerol-3-phosphate responsive antiterminator [Firmicutes bacterium HGW-Firmicutes-1]|jgi:glycerol uptake operon antiterminator|nr:MAG: glycerol-3-phosphate responsive antiterminator [Firmicutes bacterium HGW-Firmicutes-1]
MKKKDVYEILVNNPIIAAVSDREKLDKALKSPCEVIFMLYGDIFTLKEDVQAVLDQDKYVFVHLDLIKGFSNDAYSLKYIQEQIKPSGVVTTKTSLVKKAKELNCFVVQRLFILDSKSIQAGIQTIHQVTPDAVEIMPGVVPKITKEINKAVRVPIITGGLIETKHEIIESLDAGATCISTSCEKIWYS